MAQGDAKTTEAVAFGISYRRPYSDHLFAHPEDIEIVEVLSDQYMDMPQVSENEARKIASNWPVVLHGVDLSIGTIDSFDFNYLEKMHRIAEWVNPILVSDHLCVTKVSSVNIGQLTPIVYNDDTLSIATKHIRSAVESFSVPFLVENISSLFSVPGCTMSEMEFITRLTERARCGILLDLTNVYNNEKNNGLKCEKYLDNIPLECVYQIHLAGSEFHDELTLDTHSQPVPEEVFSLLEYCASRLTNLKAIIIERDQNYPPFSEITSDLDKARQSLRSD